MSDRVSELLLKAVRLLDLAEQDEVLQSLLYATLSPGAVPAPVGAAPPALSNADRAARVVGLFGGDPTTGSGSEGGLKVLPVRLPVTDYERLREWSGRQGFSMAVVIRTLLERFLEEQTAPPVRGPQTGAP